MNRQTIVALHGFTQTTSSFRRFAQALAHAQVLLHPLPLEGHQIGQGPERIVTGTLWDGAASAVNRAPLEENQVWLGYSMGARLALHVALAHAESVAGLILISGTAGIDDQDERAERRKSDNVTASRIEQIGVHEFLNEWLAQSLFAALPDDQDDLEMRHTNHAAGLASSLRMWGTGTMDPPLWERLNQIAVPTLVMAGTNDPKFMALGQRLSLGIGPNARFVAIENAGHALHLEQPGRVADVIADWLPR